MARTGVALRDADARAIYLVHGTFVGADALCLIREIARHSHGGNALALLPAAGGDSVQQQGIAGTNFASSVWAWRAWRADVRLGRILRAGLGRRDTLARPKLGTRVHGERETLLVDYGQGACGPAFAGAFHRYTAGLAPVSRRAGREPYSLYGWAIANDQPRALGET